MKMNDMTKTGVFVAVSLLLTGAAFFRIPDRSGTNVTFNDQGQPFFPNFKDSLACTDLEVIDYDPSTATAARFKVMLKDGKWVIPSHYNYPADAKDRLAKTAAGVMDLNKDTIRSDRTEDQEDLGVIDPIDTKQTTLKGRGKRVTLRDKSEKTLADFIIGKEVAGRPSQRYVRVPDQKRTYGVNVKVDLSTKFADWIETNLLKLDAGKVRKIVFDNYKVDLERGPMRGEILTIERKDSTSPWTMQGLKPGEELNTEKLSALTTALGDLKIVGVRPKPPGLSRDLKTTGKGGITLTNSVVASLQSKGFYPTRDGRLLSNQGDVIVSTEECAVYTIRFGEVFFASGEDLSAGVEDAAANAAKAKDKDKAKKDKEGTAESRYVMVTVAFDPSLIPAEKPKQPEGPLTIPDDPFQLAPDDPKRVAEEKEAKEKADREKADHEKKVADSKKRVDDLTDRFADWYYVTPGESFRTIALDRKALTEPKPAKPETPPPSFPGMPGGFPNMPHP